jgi:hypothetical protein
MKILEIIGFDKETRKEINVKESIAVIFIFLSMTVISDNWESICLVAFMIISAFILLYLSKKQKKR